MVPIRDTAPPVVRIQTHLTPERNHSIFRPFTFYEGLETIVTLTMGCLNAVFATMSLVSGPELFQETLLVMTITSSMSACGFSAVHAYRGEARNHHVSCRVYPATAAVSLGCLVAASAAYACHWSPWYMFASQCISGICLATVTLWRFVCT